MRPRWRCFIGRAFGINQTRVSPMFFLIQSGVPLSSHSRQVQRTTDHEFSDIQFLFNKRIIYIYIYIWWDSWTLGVVSKCQVSIVRVLQAKENSLVMIEEAVNLLEISLCSTKELRLLLFFESTGTGVIYLTMSNDLLITCFRTKAFLLLSRTWKISPLFVKRTNNNALNALIHIF